MLFDNQISDKPLFNRSFLLFFPHNEYVSGIAKLFMDFVELDFLKGNITNSDIMDNSLLRFCGGSDDVRENLEELAKLSDTYKDATRYVLSTEVEEFKDLSTIAKFCLYQSYFNPNFGIERIETIFSWTIKGHHEMPIIPDGSIHNHKTLLQLADSVKGAQFKIEKGYMLNNLRDALIFTFMNMVMNDVKVTRCKCCNKFFAPGGRSDTKYCARIAPNSTKTCFEIGAINIYHKKVKENPIMGVFQKEYKKMNARVRIKKITQEKFYQWSEDARKLRDKAIDGKMDVDVFINQLKELEG